MSMATSDLHSTSVKCKLSSYPFELEAASHAHEFNQVRLASEARESCTCRSFQFKHARRKLLTRNCVWGFTVERLLFSTPRGSQAAAQLKATGEWLRRTH